MVGWAGKQNNWEHPKIGDHFYWTSFSRRNLVTVKDAKDMVGLQQWRMFVSLERGWVGLKWPTIDGRDRGVLGVCFVWGLLCLFVDING